MKISVKVDVTQKCPLPMVYELSVLLETKKDIELHRDLVERELELLIDKLQNLNKKQK
jgi:hypothetical protein